MKKIILLHFFAIIFGAIFFSFSMPSKAWAQSQELTQSDVLALLYAKNLQFSPQSEPIVRIRLAEGLEDLLLTPSASFSVHLGGHAGSRIELPGERVYRLSYRRGRAGRYRYAFILEREKTREALLAHQKRYENLGIESEITSIGSIFSLHAQVFDSRAYLLLSKAQPELSLLEAQRSTLPSRLEGYDIHSALEQFPRLDVILEDLSGQMRIQAPYTLSLDFGDASARLHQLGGTADKPSDLILNEQLIVSPDPKGKLAVVQAARIETLLRGIVPAEIYASAPEAALSAQSVAARSTLLAQLGARHLSDPYHLCNQQHCQVYLGLAAATERTDKAIRASAGQVLFHSEQGLATSYYSSHCGGISAGTHESWGLAEQNYLPTRQDQATEDAPSFADEAAFRRWYQTPSQHYCTAQAGQQAFSSTRHARWQVRLTRQDIEAQIKAAGLDIGELQSLKILRRGKSFRVTALALIGSKGEQHIERELPIRQFLGGLKSALFYIDFEPNAEAFESLTLYGAGFGHGVGLCQTGAIGMAQRGHDYQSILKHYYPNTTLKKLW